MKIEYTNRGFEIIIFLDRNEKECSLQQSSVADFETPGTSAIWLGVTNERMHISFEQVKKLLPHLQAWVESGSFKEIESKDNSSIKPCGHPFVKRDGIFGMKGECISCGELVELSSIQNAPSDRSINIKTNTEAELAIRNAIKEVEKLKAHETLTNIISKLEETRIQLAELIDSNKQ